MFNDNQELYTLNVIILEHRLLDPCVIDDESGKVLDCLWLTVAVDFYTRMIWDIEISSEYPSQKVLEKGALFKRAKKQGFTIIDFGISGIPKVLSGKDEKGEIVKQVEKFWTVDKMTYKRYIERQFGKLSSEELIRVKMTTGSSNILNCLRRKYTSNGVRVNYIYYKSKELEPLLKGKEVIVCFDKNDLSCVYIQNPILLEFVKVLAIDF